MMTIQEVIRECVVALFSDEILERTLVLKGGTALHLIEKIDTRLSTDIDFSVINQIDNPDDYFWHVAEALREHFGKLSYEVFDTEHGRKPKEKAESKPRFWAGWYFEFKLIDKNFKPKNLEDKRRNALIPDGAASSKIHLEISEYEYCASVEKVEIDGSCVTSYSSTLLILEKLRAICQQHPDYPHGKLKNRARDYFDIYQLVRKHRSEMLYDELKKLLPEVFKAKDVSLELLKKIFEPRFVTFQASHFASVEATVKGKIEPFDYYLEQLRLLLSDLGYL
jgi:predicted nucleotidyltransferase component of viral defense system